MGALLQNPASRLSILLLLSTHFAEASFLKNCVIALREAPQALLKLVTTVSGAEFKKTATYKILTADGLVQNLRFLGLEQSKHSQGSSLLFLDLQSGRNVKFSRESIVSFIEIPSLKKLTRPRDEHANWVDDSLAESVVSSLEKTQSLAEGDKVSIAVSSEEHAQLSPALRSELTTHAQKIRDALKNFDSDVAGLSQTPPGTRPVHIQLIEKSRVLGAFTQTTLVAGEQKDLIVIPYLVEKSTVNGKTERHIAGISTSVVLHERAHHLLDTGGSDTKQSNKFLQDSALQEGLADFLTAYHLKDPAIGVGHLNTKDELRNIEWRRSTAKAPEKVPRHVTDIFSAIHYGKLEEHRLSLFYSYPLWRISVEAENAKSGDEVLPLLKKLLTRTKQSKPEERYYGHRNYVYNIETQHLENIEVFYASLYREAFIENKIGGQSLLQQAYLDAKLNFSLHWPRIEALAQTLREAKTEE